MNPWMTIIQCYWRVMTFKETPANTPYSYLLLALIVLFYYALILAQWLMLEPGTLPTLNAPVGMAALLILSYVIYTWALLRVLRHKNRFVQSLSCLLIGHALVHLFALPLLLLAPWLAQVAMPAAFALFVGLLYLVLTLLLTFWQFMISVHVYKHALDLSSFPAVLAGFGLLAANILTVSL